MFCALLTSRYQVSVYRTNGPLVDGIFFTFEGNKDNHQSLYEFEFQRDQPLTAELAALERL